MGSRESINQLISGWMGRRFVLSDVDWFDRILSLRLDNLFDRCMIDTCEGWIGFLFGGGVLVLRCDVDEFLELHESQTSTYDPF